MENEGYPPLRIGEASELGKTNQLSISAGTSSQYISALLMIAPVLPRGLELTLEGNIVSRSYIEMTLGLMENFGVTAEWEGSAPGCPAAGRDRLSENGKLFLRVRHRALLLSTAAVPA